MTVSVYPADVLSTPPKLAYGMRKLKESYTGNCLSVTNALGSATTFPFVNQDIDISALNSHIGSNPEYAPGKVTKWYDQMHANLYNLEPVVTQEPKIGNLNIEGTPSIVFEGGSQSGALFGMATPAITSLGFTPQQFTMYAVMQSSSSMYRNQASTPGVAVGTIISMDGSPTPPVVNCFMQVLQFGGTDTANGPGRGTISMRDNFYIELNPTDWMSEMDPMVLAVSTGFTGTSIYQNEGVRTINTNSPIVYNLDTLNVGKRFDSVVGGTSQCGDFQIVALMLYTESHTAKQRARVSASLYNCFSIDFAESRYNKANVIMQGDSIPAGYVTLGIYGMVPRLRDLLPNVRFGNFCVPGAQTTFDTGTPTYAYMLGGFSGTVLPQLTYSTSKNFFIQMGPGNDYARLPTPAVPADVYAARVSMIQQAYAAGVTRCFLCTLPPRVASYQNLIAQENILIRAGAVANNYTVIEVANDSIMSVNPGPAYYDSGHMTGYGHQRCAQLISNSLTPFL